MAAGRRDSSEEVAFDGLHPGRNGIGREQVSEIQRARMLTAMVEVVAERGVANATVAHVVARSGVSRRTFYELFEDREDCFLAAFDEAVKRASEYVTEAYGTTGRWGEQMRAGLAALLEFLDDDPGMGRLIVVEALAAGPRALERRQNVLAMVIEAVDAGRGEAKPGSEIPPLTAEGIVGAVFSVIHTRLQKKPGRLTDLVNPLMATIVLPYRGPAVARKELDRPIAKPAGRARRVRQDPLRDLEMRLTYRTVRVLLAVAANPGSSNRQVADTSGIADQGQMSKLLGRLDHLGLIHNTGAGPARGEPNAWTLTAKGWDVHATISAQTNSHEHTPALGRVRTTGDPTTPASVPISPA